MNKKKTLMIVISAFLMAMVLSACGAGNSVQAASKDPVVHTETNGYGATANRATEVRDERVGDGSGLLMGLSGDLTQKEVSDLLYMREEEKLARDVYAYLYSQWQLPVFDSIAQSEQNHMDSILELLTAYGIEDPAAQTAVGQFTNSTLQDLYDTLIVQGSTSLEEALRVGALIEEVDIQDLDETLTRTDKVDLERVYSNLMFGSENHLRSFTSQLSRQLGISYQPVQLDQDRYDQIIADQPGQRGRAGN